MQFAVIFQSAPSAGVIRQTAVVPAQPQPRVFTRNGAGNRGSSGAWSEASPVLFENERLVGEVVAIEVTANDQRDLGLGVTPSTLLQKLVRKVSAFTTVNPSAVAQDTLDLLVKQATESPLVLAGYRSAKPQVTVQQAPTVQVVAPVAQPVSQPQVTVSAVPVSVEEPALGYTTLEYPTLTDPEVAVYIPRTIYGTPEADAYRFAQANQQAIGIDGHAGTGKTSSAKHASAVLGLPFLRQECHAGITVNETQGSYIPQPDGTLVWVDSPLVKAIQQPSVVLLNELSRTSAKNAPLFLGLLNERQLILNQHRGEVIKVHPECVIVADYNSGYRGTTGIDQAVLDRFGVKWHFTWSEEAEAIRIPSASLRQFAKELRLDSEREDKFSTPVTTRLLLNFVKQAQGLSLEYAVGNFLASFPAEEQDALKMHFHVHSANIATELGVAPFNVV